MLKASLGRLAGALGLAFMLVAGNGLETPAEAARNTEPFSCKINGRTYNPQSSYIAVEVNTGEILYGDDVDELRYPASMTKMMTMALIFDALRDGTLALDYQITVRHSQDVRDTYSNSRSTWLRDGTVITVEQAIQAISVASANNVSVIIAEHIAGSEAAFVEMMNKKAAQLGMGRTHFTNTHGLPDRNQVSTARDMARLAIYIQSEYPEYFHFFSEKSARFGPHIRHNYNELVTRNSYIDGMKTGFICDSGYNVTISAEKGDADVVAVVYGGRTPHQRNVQAKQLVDKALKRALDRAALIGRGRPVVDLPVLNLNNQDDTTVASDNSSNNGVSNTRPVMRP